jgi:coproporphyrinogen III oxidase
MDKMKNTDKIAESYHQLHQVITETIEKADGKGKFSQDEWSSKLGTGVVSVMNNGAVIEKGAVNFSYVKGKFTAGMEKVLGKKAGKYVATGISSILHPENPWVPVIHMNVRYFELDNGTKWFGGGIDLTPHIIEPEDAKWFHQSLKDICDHFDKDFYSEYKKWADDYFFLPHRNETRGIGGIFFDWLKPNTSDEFDKLFDFTRKLAERYPLLYSALMKKHSKRAYSQREKKWQALRRGRYVEFNLVYDRGTKFGLESGRNPEAILVSLPANAAWDYNYSLPVGGFEVETSKLLKKGIDWINISLNPNQS